MMKPYTTKWNDFLNSYNFVIQGPKKWFAAKEGPRQEQAIFSGSVVGTVTPFPMSIPVSEEFCTDINLLACCNM